MRGIEPVLSDKTPRKPYGLRHFRYGKSAGICRQYSFVFDYAAYLAPKILFYIHILDNRFYDKAAVRKAAFVRSKRDERFYFFRFFGGKYTFVNHRFFVYAYDMPALFKSFFGYIIHDRIVSRFGIYLRQRRPHGSRSGYDYFIRYHKFTSTVVCQVLYLSYLNVSY